MDDDAERQAGARSGEGYAGGTRFVIPISYGTSVRQRNFCDDLKLFQEEARANP